MKRKLSSTTLVNILPLYETRITNNLAAVTTINGDAATPGSIANLLASSTAYSDAAIAGIDLSQIETNRQSLITINGDVATPNSVLNSAEGVNVRLQTEIDNKLVVLQTIVDANAETVLKLQGKCHDEPYYSDIITNASQALSTVTPILANLSDAGSLSVMAKHTVTADFTVVVGPQTIAGVTYISTVAKTHLVGDVLIFQDDVKGIRTFIEPDSALVVDAGNGSTVVGGVTTYSGNVASASGVIPNSTTEWDISTSTFTEVTGDLAYGPTLTVDTLIKYTTTTDTVISGVTGSLGEEPFEVFGDIGVVSYPFTIIAGTTVVLYKASTSPKIYILALPGCNLHSTSVVRKFKELLGAVPAIHNTILKMADATEAEEIELAQLQSDVTATYVTLNANVATAQGIYDTRVLAENQAITDFVTNNVSATLVKDDSAVTDLDDAAYAQQANSLSDLTDKAAALANLGGISLTSFENLYIASKDTFALETGVVDGQGLIELGFKTTLAKIKEARIVYPSDEYDYINMAASSGLSTFQSAVDVNALVGLDYSVRYVHNKQVAIPAGNF